MKVYEQEPIQSWTSQLHFNLTPRNVMTVSEDDNAREAIEDRVRLMIENCDLLQGCLCSCDTDWDWSNKLYLEAFSDSCPKLPSLLQSFRSSESVSSSWRIASFFAYLSDYSHLLHIPSLGSDYQDPMTQLGPGILLENISVQFRVPATVGDMAQVVQPLFVNSSSNYATGVVNAGEDQWLVGLEPTLCSHAQTYHRGRGHDVSFLFPRLEGVPNRAEEYETICARTRAFKEFFKGLIKDFARIERDDEVMEVRNKIALIAEYYAED